MLAASNPKYSATRILVDSPPAGRPPSPAWWARGQDLLRQRRAGQRHAGLLLRHRAAPRGRDPPCAGGHGAHQPGRRREGAGQRRPFLEAMLLGIEVTCRVSYALNPTALYNRGFHPSAICGAFGAAAAAGHLFRLTPSATSRSASPCSRPRASWPGPAIPTENSRPFNPGLAARNGTTAAYLAHLGFGGPPTPFEGKYDVFTAFSGRRNPEALLAGWGKHFYLPEFAYKLYSSCSFTHPGLDALLDLARTPAEAVRRAGHRAAVPQVRRPHDRQQRTEVPLRPVHPPGRAGLRPGHDRRHPAGSDAPSRRSRASRPA